MPITIRDVAKRLNLSITTVSRALDGYDDVAKATRQRVIRTAREMGYAPSHTARQLRRSRADAIGYILPTSDPRFTDPFFSEFIAGLGDETTLHNLDLMISTAPPDKPAERQMYERWVHSRRVDGIVLSRMRTRDWRVRHLIKNKFPVVALGHTLLSIDLPYVEVDARAGFVFMVKHLVERGHKRIAYIGAPENLTLQVDRLAGFRDGVEATGLTFDESLIVRGDLTRAGGYQAAQRLLSLREPPTAIMGANDLTAIGAIRAAHERGLIVYLMIVVALLTAACAQAPAAAPTAEPTKAPVAAPTQAPAPTAAPAQPLVFLSTQLTPVEEQEKMRNIILKDMTGAKVDFISDAEGVVVDRILAEQKAGKVAVGVVGVLHGTFPNLLAANALEDLTPLVAKLSDRPIVKDFVFTDANGAPLDFTLTAYPHALCFVTRLGDYWLAFADEETLYFKLPAGHSGVSFRVYAVQGRADRRGGEFKGDPEHRTTHRNIAYTTNARVVSNEIIADKNGYLRVNLRMNATAESALLVNITPRLGFNRGIVRADQVLHDAETRWHEWFAAAPAMSEAYAEQYYYAWWILGMGLLSPRFYLTREAMMPSAIHYVGVWQWDAFFHALAYQYVDQKLAENQLRVVLDHQREDGMIPDAVHDEGVVLRWKLPGIEGEADVTKPPLIAWAALKLYATSGNRDFLDEIYEPLCRWNRWWFDKNDDDHDGIAQYNHGFSSRLDDSPLWDEGMPVESPELNTYLVMQLDALAQIADILGLADDAAQWRAQASDLAQKIIAHFWDEEAGVFWAMRDHKPIRVLTPFNLYPLLTGRMPRAINDRLVSHLTNPNEFWTGYPIPTVARNDPKCDLSKMWRGPTWVNINYLFVEGLTRAGYPDLARELRDRTLKLLMRHNDIYEYYNPDTGDPPPHAASVFGWSSAVFVDLAIEASRSQDPRRF